MSRDLPLVLASFAAAAVWAGCGESTGPSEGFLVAGTIQNNTQAPIPTNARVVVAWVVSSASPDRTYVFGEGLLDRARGTFGIRFDRPPPLEALNAGTLGVGIIVVTTNMSLRSGDDISSVPETELVGAAGQYAVIYVRGSPEQAAQVRAWAAKFEAGYGVGEGIKVPGSLDEFAPVNPSTVVLIIDDLGNIEFVDWT